MISQFRRYRVCGRLWVCLGAAAILAGLAGCGGSSSAGSNSSSGGSNSNSPNPAPSISTLSPVSSVAGAATVSLTVSGANFVSSSTVQWNGTALATSYVGSTQLSASIPAADLASAGSAGVTVSSPAPGGGVSSSLTFTINNPSPAVSFISPISGSVGASTFTLTVTGSNFVPTSTVEWDGSSRTTTYVSATQLTAAINAADLSTAQTASVVVVNASPGGGTSTAASYLVKNPLPTVSSFSPASTNAGAPAFTLTINGTNFLPGSTVEWNGSLRTTTYVSATQLTALINASDVLAAGSATVTVVNAAPGGGSPTGAFIVHAAIPANASYVAPTGSDANPGTIGQPYLTIQHCAGTVASGGTCVIRAGTYHETVTPNSGITITSYYGESVTVDGADPVTGWTLYQGSIYKASATLGTGDTNQVFVGSQMMTEARWPNGNDLFHVNWATAQTGTVDRTLVDSNLPAGNWTGARIHLWSGIDPWAHQTGVVTSYGSGQLGFSDDGATYLTDIVAMPGGYYYLFGTLTALDAANEWYYDPAAKLLYFWAPGGVNPSALAVSAKQRQYAFDLSGKSNVTIEGINLFAATINTNGTSASNTLDSINAQYVSQFSTLPDVPGYPTSYWFDHINDTGIILNGTANILQNSVIAWSAGDGVALYGSNNTVRNNLIYNTGYSGSYASGITLADTGQSVTSNTIHNSARTAIFATYVDTVNSSVQPSNDEISYNNLYGGMFLSSDGAELYGGGTVSGTQIDHNWFHGTQILVPGPAVNFPTSGVYLDYVATGFLVDQNVLWDNGHANIFLDTQTAPLDDVVLNNSIPDIGSAAYIAIYDTPACGTTQVANNLVFVAPSLTTVDPTCSVTNNSSTAPGATQMTASVQVGCTLPGCSSSGPPAVSGSTVAASVATDPWDTTVSAGLAATFKVTAAGSPTITYQWQKNGVDIAGATSASYTTPATSASDNGSTFTVQVSNAIGGATSRPAALTVN